MNRRSGLFVLLACLVWGGAAPAAPKGSLIKVDLQRRSVGTFYVGGEIRGYGPVELLVDTGSTISVVNEAILAKLKAAGTATFSRNLEGRMADGTSRVVPVYRLSELRLGEHCVLKDIEAAIFERSTRPILGMDLLSRLAPFTFTADPPGIEFTACDALALPATVSNDSTLPVVTTGTAVGVAQ